MMMLYGPGLSLGSKGNLKSSSVTYVRGERGTELGDGSARPRRRPPSISAEKGTFPFPGGAHFARLSTTVISCLFIPTHARSRPPNGIKSTLNETPVWTFLPLVPSALSQLLLDRLLRGCSLPFDGNGDGHVDRGQHEHGVKRIEEVGEEDDVDAVERGRERKGVFI